MKVGDRVWAADPETGVRSLNAVVATTTALAQVVRVTVGDQTITTTHDHPFYVQGHGWRPARTLEAGHTLPTLDGPVLPVATIAFVQERVPVYNLTVAGHHTFFVGAGRVLVHNADGCLEGILRAIMLKMGKRGERNRVLFKCAEFASEFRSRLEVWRVHGHTITIRSNNPNVPFIYSEKLGRSITENGEHVAVRIGDRMYDNIGPDAGILYDEWLADLSAVDGYTILPPEAF